MRITKAKLQSVIEQYNRYLDETNCPYRFANQPQYGHQQLVLVEGCRIVEQVEQGTSRECVAALYKKYSQLYRKWS